MDGCYEVPLIEKLRSVSKDYRTWEAIQWAEDGTETGHRHIPVGYMMHEAADEIERLGSEVDRLMVGEMSYADENWKRLVEKYDPLIGRYYRDEDGAEYEFAGLLHGRDDFHFVMYLDGRVELLTCVGTPEGMGFTLIEEGK